MLNNETLVKYGMQESYAAFLEFNSSVIDLLSTKQDIEEAIGSSNFDFDIKKSLKTLASSSNYNDIVHTVLEAFENNKLFIKGGTEAIAKSLVSDETSNEFQKTLIAARALRDAYKAYLNKSPIYGVVDGKRYEWVPNKESSKTKGSYQNHFIEESDANVRIGEKDSNFKILTHYTLSKSNSEIQSILNNLVLANSTINGKNFRVNNSSTKAKKTGRKIESVKILNTDGLVYDDNGNSTNVGINKFAQSHDLSVSNIDELNANAESYTIRSEDLEYIVSDGSKVRRNIILDEVARANMSDDGWSDFESKVESNFSIAQPTELYVINDGVRPSNGVTADSQSSGTITDNKDSVEPDGLSLVSADEIPDVDIDELLFEKSEDSENMLGAEVSLESAMEYLSRLFPGVPTSTFKFLNEIRTSSKKAYGRFVRGVIEVEKASSNTVFENVVRHEAFHKV